MENWAGVAKATPGVAATLACNASTVAFCPSGTEAATINGPLKPGPNPVARASNAWRVVVLGGSLPASVKASRIEKKGRISTIRQTSEARAATIGRRCTVRLHRYQNPRSEGSAAFWSRPGTCSLSTARPAKPSMAGRSVTAASMTSTTAAMAPTASPRMKGSWRMNRPSRERITVVPAKTTDRPDVARETAVDCRGVRPSASPWR